MDTYKLTSSQISGIMDYLGDEFEELNNHIKAALTEYEWYDGESDEAIYEFNVDCGRMGDLEGIFVAKKKDIEWLLNFKYEVYFGEVLGKHSEVFFKIQPKHIKMVSDNPKEVKSCRASGFNPFNYTVIGGEENWCDLSVFEIMHLNNQIK